jgi:VanZ family protein
MDIVCARRLVAVAGWLAVVAIAVLSLAPGDARPGTGLPGKIEHVIAYVGAGLLLGCGHRRALLTGSLLIVYAALLEGAQAFSPARHPALLDFAASSLGALLGVGAAALACAMSLDASR